MSYTFEEKTEFRQREMNHLLMHELLCMIEHNGGTYKYSRLLKHIDYDKLEEACDLTGADLTDVLEEKIQEALCEHIQEMWNIRQANRQANQPTIKEEGE